MKKFLSIPAAVCAIALSAVIISPVGAETAPQLPQGSALANILSKSVEGLDPNVVEYVREHTAEIAPPTSSASVSSSGSIEVIPGILGGAGLLLGGFALALPTKGTNLTGLLTMGPPALTNTVGVLTSFVPFEQLKAEANEVNLMCIGLGAGVTGLQIRSNRGTIGLFTGVGICALPTYYPGGHLKWG